MKPEQQNLKYYLGPGRGYGLQPIEIITSDPAAVKKTIDDTLRQILENHELELSYHNQDAIIQHWACKNFANCGDCPNYIQDAAKVQAAQQDYEKRVAENPYPSIPHLGPDYVPRKCTNIIIAPALEKIRQVFGGELALKFTVRRR